MAGNRTIIGSETDDTKKVELDRSPNYKVTMPVTIYDSNGNQVNLASGLVPNAYTSMTLSYDGSNNLKTVVYKNGATAVATLTLGYDGSNNLVSVIKS